MIASASRKKPRSYARKLWLSFILVLLLVLLPAHVHAEASSPQFAEGSTASPDSITLSVALVDSLMDAVDRADLEKKLLQIDLDECRELGALSDSLHSRQLALVRESYEFTLDLYKEAQQAWWERLLRRPEVWLSVGLWIGAQAR